MKRLAIGLAVVAALAISFAGRPPAEGFNKVDVTRITSTSRLFVPSFQGVHFLPSKVILAPNCPGTTSLIDTVVFYFKAGGLPAGPATATDSVTVGIRCYNGPTVIPYYGPFSDTMRVDGPAGIEGFIYAWGN